MSDTFCNQLNMRTKSSPSVPAVIPTLVFSGFAALSLISCAASASRTPVLRSPAPIESASTPAPTPVPADTASAVPLAQLPINAPDTAADSTQGSVYYVSAKGSDRASGKSPKTAWRTLARASRAHLGAGDRLMLEGGMTFKGSLSVDAPSAPSSRQSLVITSYGQGPATVDAACGDGITIRNRGYVKISRLLLVGCGPEKSSGAGLRIQNALPGGIKLSLIRIDSLTITGFGRQGLVIQGTGRSGFKDVRITRVKSTRNALSGIEVMSDHYPYETEYAHEDVYIGDSEGSENAGVKEEKESNTGSGIVVSDVRRALIERSRAYGNGSRSRYKFGGPVGIWAWNATDVTIQFNESVENHTGGEKDGGGFDLDGGVHRSVLQYNYSRGNDGPGYMVMTFPDGPSSTHDVVRYNLSVDDGQRNNYPAVQILGDTRDVDVFQNVIVATGQIGDSSPTRGATPGPAAGVGVLSSHYVAGDDPRNLPRDIRVIGNVLLSQSEMKVFTMDYETAAVTSAGNRQGRLGVQLH